MNLAVEVLTPESEQDYDNFVRSIPTSLFYASLGYRTLLTHFLAAEEHYLIARDSDQRIVGVLPAFVLEVPGKGCVANSLPFYGSHGGVVTSDTSGLVAKCLLEHFRDFATARRCLTSTIISSPFDTNLLPYYGDSTSYKMTDSRIGQLTRLPKGNDESSALVMNALPSKTRNMVRKAEKLGIKVTANRQDGAMLFLANTHEANMAKIGGIAKPKHFFSMIEEKLEYETNYRIYTASYEGRTVAALLLFYFNQMVEYFTPVIVEQYRSSQPLSLLIYRAMSDAVTQGFEWWNWGGTWHTQDGVYRFKQSWGAIDMPYRYFTNVMDLSILTWDKNLILSTFPYFYVVPFDQLRSNTRD